MIFPTVLIEQNIYYNVFNQVISYWTSYKSEFSCIGPRPKAKTQIQLTEDL